MPRVSDAFLRELKSKVNLIEVVGEHVVLKQQGSNYMGLCPFHGEKTPSFSVSERKQVYHCYGCKAGGDVVRFLMDRFGLTFPEALEDLSERAGVALPKDFKNSPQEAQAFQRAKTAFRLNRFCATYFRNQLEETRFVQEYAKERGLDSLMSRNFYVGYAPKGWEGLATKLTQAKAPLPLAQELGLLRQSKKKTLIDAYRGRLMFPVTDQRGRVAGFGGRILPGEESDPNAPKYLNSPESFLFQKGNLLFAWYQAYKHIRRLGLSIVVEGYLDAIRFHERKLPVAVATLGTALTEQHLKQLARTQSKIVVTFDGDAAGQKAMIRAMELGLRTGVNLHGLFLKEGQDPDDWARGKEANAILEEFRSAKPLFDQKLDQIALWLSKRSDTESRTQALKTLKKWIDLDQDPMTKAIRADQVQERLRLSPQLISAILPNAKRSAMRQERKGLEVREVKRSRRPLSKRDRLLLGAFVYFDQFEDLFESVFNRMPAERTLSCVIEEPGLRPFVEAHFCDAQSAIDFRAQPGDFLEELEPHLAQPLIALAVDEKAAPSKEEVEQSLSRVLLQAWEEEARELKVKLNAPKEEDAKQLLEEYIELTRKLEAIRAQMQLTLRKVDLEGHEGDILTHKVDHFGPDLSQTLLAPHALT